jgi:transposase
MKARTQNVVAVTAIGVDIGKDVFHVVGFSADGKIALRRKIKRLALAETFKKLPPCIVGMEACLSAFRQPNVAGTRTRTADHSGNLRQAVRQGIKE